LKNGALLEAAEAMGFDVIVTTDREMPNQQNFTGRQISILILRAATNRISDLRPWVPAGVKAIESIRAGQVVWIS
jgi:hypothetical protein